MSEATLLSFIWIIPVLCAVCTLPLHAENHLAVKKINVVGHGLNLIVAIYLVVQFLSSFAEHGAGEQGTVTKLYFATDVVWIPALNIHYNIGVDGLSMLMILLTAMIILAGTFASWKVNTQAKEFFFLLNTLVAGVYGVFMSFDLFTFFLFYEVAVLPMYLLIGVWGTGPKEYSAMKLTLMLVAGSALIVAAMFGLYYESGLRTFDLNLLSQHHFSQEFQNWAYPMLFIGFGVLSALFPFHTWSPDGHASAPTAVSMLHAGVLMKLGGYGILRVAMYLLPEGAQYWMPFFLVLITLNVAVGPLVAVAQKDLKYITAYSSVSHLGLVLLGLSVGTFTGLLGASLQMISHGLLTGLFFSLIGMIYSRTHTRIVTEMGGLMKVMPFLGVAFAITGFAGLGLPGLSGFVAEATIFVGAFENADPLVRCCAVLSILSIVATAAYVIRSANFMLHGPLPAHLQSLPELRDADKIEKTAIIILMTGLLGMGLYPHWIATLLSGAMSPIFNNLTR
jgi:NADH-quinone oxidoreductase subunit M